MINTTPTIKYEPAPIHAISQLAVIYTQQNQPDADVKQASSSLTNDLVKLQKAIFKSTNEK